MNNELIKQRVWDELVLGRTVPRKLRRHLDKLRRWAWHDNEFWAVLLERHGLREKHLSELQWEASDHALWDFHKKLLQVAQEHGISQ